MSSTRRRHHVRQRPHWLAPSRPQFLRCGESADASRGDAAARNERNTAAADARSPARRRGCEVAASGGPRGERTRRRPALSARTAARAPSSPASRRSASAAGTSRGVDGARAFAVATLAASLSDSKLDGERPLRSWPFSRGTKFKRDGPGNRLQQEAASRVVRALRDDDGCLGLAGLRARRAAPQSRQKRAPRLSLLRSEASLN